MRFAFLILVGALVSSLSAQPVVFPLTVGDRWQFLNMTVFPAARVYVQFDAVGDTIMANNQSYATIVPTRSGQRQPSLAEFYRQVGDSIFRYSPDLQKEYLVYSFSGRVQSLVGMYVTKQDTIDVWYVEYKEGSVYGAPHRVWYFTEVSHLYGSPFTSIIIVDSIGFYSRARPTEHLSLQSAVVSGRTYGTVVSVAREQFARPLSIRLNQNYPNPFNGGTRLSFELESRCFVTLQIFDILGRHIVTLIQAWMQPGNHETYFDSASLPSGSYVIRLSASDAVASRLMQLLR